MKETDSLTYTMLFKWISKNGWPKYLSFTDNHYSEFDHEYNPITSYISHYPRNRLLYFLNLAIESAKKGDSSWGQAFEIEEFLLWKMPYNYLQFYIKLKRKSASYSPLLRIYTDNNSGRINIEKSLFEIITLAELMHNISNMKLILFPTARYYRKHKKTSFNELEKLKTKIISYGGNTEVIKTVKENDFVKNLGLIEKHTGFETNFFYVLYGDISNCKLIPFGQPICLDKI